MSLFASFLRVTAACAAATAALMVVVALAPTPDAAIASATANSASPVEPGVRTASAVDGTGDADGYHVRIATALSPVAWTDVAVLKPANMDESNWIGYQCLSSDGRYVAVAVLPASLEDLTSERFAGAYAYSIAVSSGKVTALASGVGSFYFSPSCGLDDTAVFTASVGQDQQITEITRFDLRSGARVSDGVVSGELTSAAPVGSAVVAAEGDALVLAPSDGSVSAPSSAHTIAESLPGVAYGIRPSSATEFEFIAGTRKTATSSIWAGTTSGKISKLGGGPTTMVHLFLGSHGKNIVAGATTQASGLKNIDVRRLTASLETVSLDGGVAFSASKAAPRPASQLTDGSDVAQAEVIATRELVQSTFNSSPSPTSLDVGSATESSDTARTSVTTITGSVSASAKAVFNPSIPELSKPATSPGATIPTCAVPRLSPTLQAMQPGNAQVSWAIEMAEQGQLKGTSSTRPANFDNMGLASYQPSVDFPPVALTNPSGDGTTTVPRSVMEAIVAQESNYDQASWHALPGIAGDPLIADYYGSGGTITTINYTSADCGYGLAQVTTGMHVGDTTITANGQKKVAVDYEENVAAGLQILEKAWNQLAAAGITLNGGSPKYLENWFFAAWAYNTGIQPTAAYGNTSGCTPSSSCTGPDGTWGLGWSNNPANPSYNPSRAPYLQTSYADAAHPSSWPYEERIMGWMASPIVRFGYTAYTTPTYPGSSTWLHIPTPTAFCSTSMYCNPTTSTCSLADSECWWHSSATTVVSCSTTCATSPYTVGAGSTEPSYSPPASRPVTKTCSIDTSVVPAGALIVDDLATPGNNLQGCSGSAWTNSGAFTLTPGTNSSGDPIGNIDLHQLGAGLGGHSYFTHTEPATTSSLIDTGVWAPNLPSTQYYKVKIHLPATGAVASDVIYTVDPGSGGTKSAVRVNQDWGSEQWVTIGTFAMGAGGTLTLTNASAMSAGKYDVAFDAAAFIPMGGTPGIPIGGATKVVDAPAGSNPAWVECGCGSRTAGDPVDTGTGDLDESATDVSAAGLGLPFEISRTYASALSDPSGPNASATISGGFGPGWSFNYGMSAATDGSGNVTVLQEDGSRVSFTVSGSSYTVSSPRFSATLSKSGTTYTYVRRGDQYFKFDVATGHLLAEYDQAGWVASPTYGQTLAYDGSGHLSTVTDPAGRTFTFTWTGSRITKITTSAGQEVDYGFNAVSQLTDVWGIGTTRAGGVNGDQDHSQYGYTSTNLMNVLRTPDNYGKSGSPTPTTSTSYDASERVSSQADPMGNTTTFVYGPDSGTGITAGQTLVTDGAGHKILYTYSNGLLASEVKGYGTSVAATWNYVYDPVSLGLARKTNPDGSVETFSYDDASNQISSSDALGRTTQSAFDASGRLLQRTTPDLLQTTYTYNAAGATLSTTISLPGQSAEASNGNPPANIIRSDSATYADAAHPAEMTTSTDFDGNVTTYAYDSDGEVTTVQDAAGNITHFAYNLQRGLKTATVSARGVAAGTSTSCTPPTLGCTTYTYDAQGRLTSTTDALGNFTRATWDADGNKLTSTDGNGHVTTTVYDADDRVKSVASPTGNIATIYNGDSTVHSRTDRGGHATTYAYDAQGRMTSATDADSKVTQYTYDTNGNRATTTDPNGTVTHTAYDSAGQLTGVSYTGTLAAAAVSYTYDLGGRTIKMIDGSGTSVFAYDTFGELSSATDAAGNIVSYSYDANANVTGIAYPGTSNSVTRAYNNRNQLASVADAAGRTTTFSYDPDGRLTTVTYPNGTTATNTFNNANQETVASLSRDSTTLATIGYGRDGAGNETSMTPSNGALGSATTYGYDSSNEITSATVSGTTTSDGYDSAGNITNNSGSTQVYDSGDRLCWSTTSTVTSPTCSSPAAGATTFATDADGERTSKTPSSSGATTYAWNAAQELISVGGSATASYTYDGRGLRVSKSSGGTTTHFVWGAGSTTSDLLTDGSTYFIYGPDDVPIEQTSSAATSPAWYFLDAQGSTTALTDSTGNVTARYTYTPWGTVAAHSGTSAALQFDGQYVDSETGFIYLRARYYDPSTAVFISIDPAVAVTMAAFSYASNNPLDLFDASGLWDVWDTVAVVGLVLVGVALLATGVGVLADAGILAGVAAEASADVAVGAGAEAAAGAGAEAAAGSAASASGGVTAGQVSAVAGYIGTGTNVVSGTLDGVSCLHHDQLGCAGVAMNIGAGAAGAGGLAAAAGGVDGASIGIAPFAVTAAGVDFVGGVDALNESTERYCDNLSEQIRSSR